MLYILAQISSLYMYMVYVKGGQFLTENENM